jgi:hypothetical protein
MVMRIQLSEFSIRASFLFYPYPRASSAILMIPLKAFYASTLGAGRNPSLNGLAKPGNIVILNKMNS